jgi:ABC-2 type transport system permease protein
VTGAIVSAALIVMWTGKPAPRASFQRRAKGNLASTLLEGFNAFAWAGGVAAALMASPSGLAPEWRLPALSACLALICITLGSAWLLGRKRAR